MKKLYTLIALLVTVAINATAAIDTFPYAPTSISLDEWSKYNAGAGNDWSLFTSSLPAGMSNGVRIWQNNAIENKDAWLCTPALNFKEGKSYSLNFKYGLWSGAQIANFEVYVSNTIPSAATVDQIAATTPVLTMTDLKNETSGTKWFDSTPVTDIKGNGDTYIIFRVHGYYLKAIILSAFQIEEMSNVTIVTPEAPTGLQAIAGADAKMTVDLSWTLPTTGTNGEELTGDDAITGVKIWRDGELAATLDTPADHWQDSELTGLTAGVHTYKVAVLTANAESQPSDEATTGYVGPFVYAPGKIDFSQWSVYNAGSGSSKWSAWTNNKPAGEENCARLWHATATDGVDAWLISPAFDLKEGKSYTLSFQYGAFTDVVCSNFDVYVSTVKPSSAETVAEIAATTPVFSKTDLSNTTGSIVWTPVTIDDIKGNGDTYVLFRAHGSFYKGAYVAAFTLEENSTATVFKPAAPYNLAAEDDGNQNVNLSWELLTESTDGLPFGDGVAIDNVKITRDGKELVTLTGAATEYTDENVEPGEHTYTVSAYADNTWSEPSEEVSVTVAKAVRPESLPWNPTVTGLTSSQFAEDWTKFSGAGHGYSTGTWSNRPTGLFINVNGAANAWVISKPLEFPMSGQYTLSYTITSTNGTTNYSIGLVDSTEPEDFTLTIVDNAIAPTSMSQETTVIFSYPTANQPAAQAEGAAQVYPRLAIRAYSTESTGSMTLKSLSLTGVPGTPTGIEAIDTDTLPAAIDVYDLQGRYLGKTTDTRLDGYAPGVYIVKTAGKTCKILK